MYNGVWYTSETQPEVFFPVGQDPDGDLVFADAYFSSSNAYPAVSDGWCNSYYGVGFSAGGVTHSCRSPQAWPEGSTIYGWGRTSDGELTSAWFGPQPIRIASGKPAAPTVTCTTATRSLTAGTWSVDPIAGPATCTITGTGSGFAAPNRLRVSVDGAPFADVSIPQSTDPTQARTVVTVPMDDGGHSIRVRAVGPAGVESDQTDFGFGIGRAGLDFPTQGSAVTTTDRLRVEATAPKAAGAGAVPTAGMQWRISGRTDETGWVDVPASALQLPVALDPVNPAGVRANGVIDTSALVGLSDGTGKVVPKRQGVRIELRVGFKFPGSVVWTGSGDILRVPHAFGKGFPEENAGPGKVALWTGELSVSESDADLSVPGGSLSVARAHTSFAGPANPHNAVFGPGWVAAFDANDDTGLSGASVVDTTHVDGMLTLKDAEGGSLVFLTPEVDVDGEPVPGIARTGANLPLGDYEPADDQTEQAGVRVVVSGVGSGAVLQAISDVGVITKFEAVTAAAVGQPAVFRPTQVLDPAVAGKTTYSYDVQGRVSAITAPLPDGVTACTPGTPSLGCRVLKVVYSATTTATASQSGDFVGQVKQIVAQVNTDPDKVLADYAYDAQGRLVRATDTRTGLSTGYAWTGNQESLRLTGITPPGADAFTFVYASNKLAKVTRPNPTTAGGGTAQLAAFVYDVPLTGTVTELPDLPQTVQRWAQAAPPTHLYATFGPDAPITGTPAANDPVWRSADLAATDDQGYTVNTAQYGAGAWQLTAADYDAHDNVIRAWDQRAIAALRADATLDKYAVASLTRYNDEILGADGKVLTAAGTLITDQWAPVNDVVSGGQVKPLRTHSITRYDEGAPNGGINPISGQPYRLPTSLTRVAEDATGIAAETLSTTLSGYEPLETGDKSGWELGQATSTTTDMNGDGVVSPGDLTSRTRYDGQGRVVEQRQPSNTGPATRVTRFYTAAASSDGCGGKPEYAGWTCSVGPKEQPAGVTVPTTKTLDYTWDGQTRVAQEVSGAVTSTTTTGFDAKDRPVTTNTVTSGLQSSLPVPMVTTTYDDQTGLVLGTSSTAGSTAHTYDSWGRERRYTNTVGSSSDWSESVYDITGRVVRDFDSQGGERLYTFDGVDAAGKAERRGLTTKVESRAITGGRSYSSTGAYDIGGALTLEKLPAGIVRRIDLDRVGKLNSLTYSGSVGGQADRPWLGWSSLTNADGKIVSETTPLAGGNAYSGTNVSAIATDLAYSYDRGGRLTQVVDRAGNLAGSQFQATTCQTRSYGFDVNGNRTTQNTRAGGSDGACAASGGVGVTRSYDAYDRPTTGGNGAGAYVYDQLGRQLTIPQADAPNPGAGAITLGYYDTDAAASIKQGNTEHSFTLDGAGRRWMQTNKTNGAVTGTLERHYTDASDNPAWSIETRGSQAGVVTSYPTLLGADLSLTVTGEVAELVLGALTPGLGHVESSSCWRKRDDQDYGQEELLR